MPEGQEEVVNDLLPNDQALESAAIDEDGSTDPEVEASRQGAYAGFNEQSGASGDENSEPGGQGRKLEIPVSLPMSVTCRSDLDEILENHKGWLESVLNPSKRIAGGRANLKNADLSGFDLTGVNLSGATLEHAKLIGANLTKANLTAANLSHADLQGAKLVGTKLKRAILDYADFRDADLIDVDLTKARIHHTHMPKVAQEEPSSSDPLAEAENYVPTESEAEGGMAELPFQHMSVD